MINWDAEKVAELTRLWNDRSLSAQQIARQMGISSRMAIIGKARRLGLPRRNPADNLPRPAPSIASRGPKPPKVEPMPQPKPVPAPEPPTTPVRLADAGPNICRFPMWQERGWPDLLICGAPGYPWCSKHRRVVYQTTVKRSA